MTPSLDHFYSEDPRRQRSRESDFGVQWREEAAGPRFRVSWIEATSELYALRQDPSHMVELLGRVPRSGHPDPLRSDLIVEAVLAGWEHRCGQPGSLRWARDSVRAIEGEPLAPIDWSVRCLASCCPRAGSATALTDAAGGPPCSACGAPLVVAAHGVPPRQLELELRGGAWWPRHSGRISVSSCCGRGASARFSPGLTPASTGECGSGRRAHPGSDSSVATVGPPTRSPPHRSESAG